MVDSIKTQMPWDTTKSKAWETLIKVIWLNNTSYIHDCAFVLICCTEVVKRLRITWITIGSCKVNGSDKGNLPARSQVIHKSWFLNEIKFNQFKLDIIPCLKNPFTTL